MKNLSLFDTSILCSWSGGKDSCLALYRAIQAGARPQVLLNMLQENGRLSRSHGLELSVLQAQARSIEIPLVTRATTWDDYEKTFIAALRAQQSAGVQAAVFGDIDLDPHRAWEEMVCQEAGLAAILPLWKQPRRELLEEFLGLGFQATIIACNDEKMGRTYLGKELDADLVREFERIGIDPCGEEGEYHTVVTAGPLFKHSIRILPGEVSQHAGYWFSNCRLG